MKKHFGGALLVAIPLLFVVVPLLFYAVLRLGWPPVTGNLMAARAMRTYSAEAHPEWEAKSAWAGYNLVNDTYYLDFDYGALRYDRDEGLVRDEVRADALQGALGVRSAVRKANEQPAHYFYWSAGWSPKDPETPVISFRVDYYDLSSAPILEESAMREIMADQAVEAYEQFAPLTPIDRFSIHYCHQGVAEKNHGLVWNIITVELPEETELSREQILTAPLEVR